MSTGWYNKKSASGAPRQPEFNLKNERVDLHPKARELMHRSARTSMGMVGPLIIGGGMVLTTFFHFIPQERGITERIKRMMDATLDEIDILEKQKTEIAAELDQIHTQQNIN